MLWSHPIFGLSAMTPLRPVVAQVCPGLHTSSFTLGEVTPMSRFCVDVVGVSPARGSWRDADSTLASVEQGKRDKHARTCRSYGFEFIPFGFSSLGSFWPEAKELLSRIS